MYNIHSHYENIYNYLHTIIAHPSVLYLHPHGSTLLENIELLREWLPDLHPKYKGPTFICFDQEPLDADYNRQLFTHIRKNYQAPFVLLNTEKDSDEKNKILKEHGFVDCYYFFHMFAASDWYRGCRFDYRILPVEQRNISKNFVTFNRITSNKRVYRSMLIAELAATGQLQNGYVSYSDVCPDSGMSYTHEINRSNVISEDKKKEYIEILNSLDLPLRIDTPIDEDIPNRSYIQSATDSINSSMFQVVTETCYWGRKKHLTEKIFKPIIARMPFILVGPAYNLEYLKSYGFKTFDRWIDESYDTIDDDMQRLYKIVEVINSINDLPSDTLLEMREVLDYNFNHFYTHGLLDSCWDEFTTNAVTATRQALAELNPKRNWSPGCHLLK